MTPITALGNTDTSGSIRSGEFRPTDGRFVYPSILRAVAAGGNLYYGPSGAYDGIGGGLVRPEYSLVLAPGANARLEFLAADSIFAGGYAVTPSGADMSTLVTPFNPGFGVNAFVDGYWHYIGIGLENGWTYPAPNVLFGFGPNTAVGGNPGAAEPSRFYARDGDVVGLRTGEILSYPLRGVTHYEGAGPVWIKAGRDIVNSGTNLNAPTLLPGEMGSIITDTSAGNLFVHMRETDVSVVSAGRDILHSSFTVAGPGTLEVSAGRNILMEDRASVTSLGAIIPGDARPGASIVMTAGVGADGLDFSAIRERYLDPANLADAGKPLADQPGKAAKTYEVELAQWLKQRYGFEGTGDEARAHFGELAPEQQNIFLRQIYFAELRAGGREYNDTESTRFQSYLRGREVIAAMFPEKDAEGNAVARSGDIIMFGGSGVRTNFGGGIQMMAPGGQIVVGVEGEVPPASAGVLTLGAGDIQMYSEGSILLGLSRIMSTMGGDILAWSAEGDINAGRGAKTTIGYTPARRVQDDYGVVTLSPNAPSAGAGISARSAIPALPSGDIDLIAPLGTIDIGEAGVSGLNINVAALHIVNAANIQAQGNVAGVPTIQAPNIGGLTEASNTAGAAAQAAAMPARSGAAEQPSVIIVEVVGYGGGDGDANDEEKQRRRSQGQQGYNSNSAVQYAGAGPMTDAQKQQLLENAGAR